MNDQLQSGATNGKRIEIIDFIRGMAVVLILLHHSGVPHGEWILAYHVPFLCEWKLLFIAILIFTVPIVSLITNYAPFMLGKFKPMRWHRKKTGAV